MVAGAVEWQRAHYEWSSVTLGRPQHYGIPLAVWFGAGPTVRGRTGALRLHAVVLVVCLLAGFFVWEPMFHVACTLARCACPCRFTLRVWTIDQAGHVSASPGVFTWNVLASVPGVAVTARPAPVSSAWRPTFALHAHWGSSEPPPQGNALIVFEFMLLGSKDLGSFHAPALCPTNEVGFGSGGSALPVDCVVSGCNGAGCEYRLALPHAPGTQKSLTVQVRARLYSGTGPVETLVWTHVVCSTTQYAVLSGGDAITCRPCPEGGDCSGATLAPVLEAQPGPANSVVLQEHVVAQQGWWASLNSSGLLYYKCPNSNAETCLQGANGTRSQCAPGYRGLVCSVCDDGCVPLPPDLWAYTLRTWGLPVCYPGGIAR